MLVDISIVCFPKAFHPGLVWCFNTTSLLFLQNSFWSRYTKISHFINFFLFMWMLSCDCVLSVISLLEGIIQGLFLLCYEKDSSKIFRVHLDYLFIKVLSFAYDIISLQIKKFLTRVLFNFKHYSWQCNTKDTMPY